MKTTNAFPKFAKIVVTDGQGRYLLPDLPNASYNGWVRGYGLVDSPQRQATPGEAHARQPRRRHRPDA